MIQAFLNPFIRLYVGKEVSILNSIFLGSRSLVIKNIGASVGKERENGQGLLCCLGSGASVNNTRTLNLLHLPTLSITFHFLKARNFLKFGIKILCSFSKRASVHVCFNTVYFVFLSFECLARRLV